MQSTEVSVWDPFIRICHWLLAIAVLVAWFIDEPLWMHTWLGYLAATLVVLRVVWGFVGRNTRASPISYAARASCSDILSI